MASESDGKIERQRSVERVRAAAAGLDLSVREMPQSTRTAEEAAAACGISVARIVKSLVFRKAGDDGAVLLLVSGKNRVDEALVAEAIGAPIEQMEARAVRDLTGFAIGGVAPLGSLSPLPTFMDADLLRYPTVWAAAGAPNAVFETAPRDLAQATGARLITLR